MIAMSVFGQMVDELSADAFKDEDFYPISEKQFQEFLKEFTFEKLKNKRLGKTFVEKFGIRDRVLSILYEDTDAIKHIRYSKYVK